MNSSPDGQGIAAGEIKRLILIIHGAVQGVGFRPFVFRLATQLGLNGYVQNSCQGLRIEIEGLNSQLEPFRERLLRDKPPLSVIQNLESCYLDPVAYHGFEIRPSDPTGHRTALALPDIAVCPECIREMYDPNNRRFLYPFTNCTHCGPRFSIIENLPYDRPNTAMRRFQLCEQCQAEYQNPLDRRFHAQPNACPTCGPHLELWDRDGKLLKSHRKALFAATDALRRGAIVAVKGIGGFHLLVAAHCQPAVRSLRLLKHREEKPFALLFPSLASVRTECELSDLEARLLTSPAAPIVLLRRLRQTEPEQIRSVIAPSVAPGQPCLGIMLPYSPLHHLILTRLDFPVVATSGNVSDEPICTDEHEALERLNAIADLFLIHNRPIVRPVDDSIVRVIAGREMILRRARGYAPLPIALKSDAPPILAVGAHLKNTIVLAMNGQAHLSQHIGDLETAPTLTVFGQVIRDLKRFHQTTPDTVVTDLHPDYLSSRYAQQTGQPLLRVQHHYAHVLSCMAENEIEPPLLGIAWDGTGYGLDGTIWGGEFLALNHHHFHRAAHLRTFPLPGADKAVAEPRRAALGLLFECFGPDLFERTDLEPLRAFRPDDLALLRKMLAEGFNCPRTSSIGRLFDAVAAITGLRQVMRFEGQAAMELEAALYGIGHFAPTSSLPAPHRGQPAPSSPQRFGPAEPPTTPDDCEHTLESEEPYPFLWTPALNSPRTEFDPDLPICNPSLVLDWKPMILELLLDLNAGTPLPSISARFHNGLVEALVALARIQAEPKIVLTGGCFQNKYLLERAVRRLHEEGFRPYWHQRVPTNDGGIALGQAAAAARIHPAQPPLCA